MRYLVVRFNGFDWEVLTGKVLGEIGIEMHGPAHAGIDQCGAVVFGLDSGGLSCASEC